MTECVQDTLDELVRVAEFWKSRYYEVAATIARLEAELRQEQYGLKQGHDALCYYCGEKCNSLAANPFVWPIPLSHADDPGVVKWHHIGCVSDRLHSAARLEAERNAAQTETKRTLEVFGVINDGLIAEAKRLKAENARLLGIIKNCAQRFREYEASHAAKGSIDGDAKARRNGEMAEMCERAALVPDGEKPE